MKKIIYLLLFLIASCAYTPDPDYLPMRLGMDKLAPWDIPIYTAAEMEVFFPGTNYSSLQSIYVAKTGSDISGGGSISTPYKSIQYAINNHNMPGIIIRVKSGIYNESLEINTLASKDSPFVLLSEDGNGTAVIDSNNADINNVKIAGQYIIIDGFEVRNCQGYGIQIGHHNENVDQGDDSYCVVRNNTIHHSGRDAVKSSLINFILIENNDISEVQHLLQNDNCIDGVAVYHSICRGNYIHDNGLGIGGYFKSGSANNIWYNNIFKNIGGADGSGSRGAGLQFGGIGVFSWRDDAWFDYPSGYEQIAYNNLFINCSAAAIYITSCKKVKIYNNSMYNCGYLKRSASIPEALILTISPNNISSDEIRIFNNVAYNDSTHSFNQFFNDYNDKINTITHGYNTIYSEGNNPVWNYPDQISSTEIISNPLFVDPGNDNLTLSGPSSAIDSGTNLPAVPTDYNGLTRPQSAGYDRGAYEN